LERVCLLGHSTQGMVASPERKVALAEYIRRLPIRR
jgi:hypothetical protein